MTHKPVAVTQVQALLILFVLIAALDVGLAKGVRTRVRFPRGSTSVTLEGGVVREDRDEYLVGARAGQKMTVHITSVEDNAEIGIYKPGSNKPLHGAYEVKDWSGKLPVSGTYLIEVGGTRGNASYTLKVTIE